MRCTASQDTILEYCGRTFEDVVESYGKVPTNLRHASLMLVDKLIAGTRVLLTFTDGSGHNRAGFAYVKSCDEGGSVGSLAKFSASFEADGALYKYTTYNNGSYPQEGEGFLLGIDNNGIRFDYDQQRQGGPYVVESLRPYTSPTYTAISL